MRPLSALLLLDVWERGQAQRPVRRALLLLEAACPDEPPELLAALRIGGRDARLLTLRQWAFGAHLESIVACPACREPLEFAFTVDDVRAEAAEPPAEPLTIRHDGYTITCRLPDSRDVAAVAGREEGARRLLERCLVEARHAGEAVAADAVPDAVVAAVGEAMAQADPQANVEIALTCPVCAHAWQSPFDIVSYFWSEIDAWAQRTIHEVHLLASAYGWREAEILAMSARRRQHYLALVGR